MLSPKHAAQHNPSCPALCRQDTTSPWSTHYGRNSQTLILMLETKIKKNIFQNKKKERKEEQDPRKKKKKKEEKKRRKKRKEKKRKRGLKGKCPRDGPKN